MHPGDGPAGVVGRSLDAAENASPVDAVEAVTRALGLALDAGSASFLVADLSGRALVRLAHVAFAAAPPPSRSSRTDRRRAGQEVATVLPFDGGPAEQAMRSQGVHVRAPAGPADAGMWTGRCSRP